MISARQDGIAQMRAPRCRPTRGTPDAGSPGTRLTRNVTHCLVRRNICPSMPGPCSLHRHPTPPPGHKGQETRHGQLLSELARHISCGHSPRFSVTVRAKPASALRDKVKRCEGASTPVSGLVGQSGPYTGNRALGSRSRVSLTPANIRLQQLPRPAPLATADAAPAAFRAVSPPPVAPRTTSIQTRSLAGKLQ